MLGKITNENLYNAIIDGAIEVMANKSHLNKINVFPVADGDTGSNLYYLMHYIVANTVVKESVYETLEAVADSAISGARGNSGIIFAQYFQGMSHVDHSNRDMTPHEFVEVMQYAVQKAYDAVETPIEGTILTVMRTFYEAISSHINDYKTFHSLLEHGYERVEKAVIDTTEQLKVLKRASVVDSGAYGFACFVKGFIRGIVKNNVSEKASEILFDDDNDESFAVVHDQGTQNYKFCTEFLLESMALPLDVEQMKEKLTAYGDSIVVAGGTKKIRLHIHTDCPKRLMVEVLKPYRLLSQKIDNMHWQSMLVKKQHKETMIVTDSVADLPQYLTDKGDIGVIPLNILIGERNYLDKLTIDNTSLFEVSEASGAPATSSQPTVDEVKRRLDYLLVYYKQIVVITVSKALSGTFQVIQKVASDYGDRVTVIDSKQNSVAQGLIAYRAVNRLRDQTEYAMEEFIKSIESDIACSKILVSIQSLEEMIRSGRLSMRMGTLAKKIGLKPIVTLNDAGEGKIHKIALRQKGSRERILKDLEKVHQKYGIVSYAITYIDNESVARAFANEIEKCIGIKAAYIVQSSSVIAAYAGKGAFAVGYISNREAL